MRKTILHIPHASTHFPNKYGFIVDAITLNKEVEDLTDHFTDDLFSTDNTISITAPFSRVFCDVERFRDDSYEIMAKLGMGATYTHLENGDLMRVLSVEKREEILQKHYDAHHQKLTIAVDKQLEGYGEALIVDCHSFPNIPHKRNTNQDLDRPDICVGTDEFHTSTSLLNHTISFFTAIGLKVGVNNPYSGTIVPLKHYKKDDRVQSIMIEINRKLYLDSNFQKSKGYQSTKQLITEYLNSVSKIRPE